MGNYKVFISNPALKDLRHLPGKDKKRISEAIDKLKGSPKNGPQIKKLVGMLSGRYRVRVGDYRIVYTVVDEHHIVYVVDIGQRKDIYR